MAESDEVLEVRRRARRRLIGATALVLLLVIVPPWLMDLEPRPVTSNLSVDIPGKDQPKLDVRGGPADAKSPERSAGKREGESPGPPDARGSATDRGRDDATKGAKPETAKDATKANAVAPPPDAVKLPAARDTKAKAGPDPRTSDNASLAATSKSTQDDAQRAAAILKNETFFIPLGSFKSVDNAKQVQQKAAGLGVRIFVENVDVKGEQQSRVRAGPFPSQGEAESARERLRAAGLDPGTVRTR
ncbi:MAG: SPOR domain-containing protein [Burkholderiales bacterium]